MNEQAIGEPRPTRELIYSSSNMEVYFISFDESKAIFVSWAFRNPIPMITFGEEFFVKYRLNAILVTSKGLHWYQYPDLEEALKAIRNVTQDFDRVISYGTSMGAYAAVRYSADILADIVIAFSPQYSVDRSIVPFEKRWHDDASFIEAEFGFLWEDKKISDSAKIGIFYDSLDSDRGHANLYRAGRDNIELVDIMCSGHRTIRVFSETRQLTQLLLGSADGSVDFKEARRGVRQKRRESGTYLRQMSRLLDAKGWPGPKILIDEARKRTKDDDAESLESNLRLSLRYGHFEVAVEEFLRLITLEKYFTQAPVVQDFERLLPHMREPALRERLLEKIEILASFNESAKELSQILKAYLYAGMGDHRDALLAVYRLENESGLRRFGFHIAKILKKMELPQDAISAAERAIKYAPKNADLIYFIGTEREAAGQLKEAVDFYQEVDRQGNLPAVPHRFRFAALYRRLGRLPEAIRESRKVIDKAPNYGNVWRLMGSCLMESNELENSIAAFQKAVELIGDSASYGGLATALSFQGNYQLAFTTAKKAAGMDMKWNKTLLEIEKKLEEQKVL